jgi:hypothetical protein
MYREQFVWRAQLIIKLYPSAAFVLLTPLGFVQEVSG